MSITDIHHRRIPRLWIAIGLVCQLTVYVIVCAYSHHWKAFMYAIIGACIAAGAQLLCALSRPGSLGLGDVTLCALLGFTLGWYGVAAFMYWWWYMSLLGVIWIVVWQRLYKHLPHQYAKAPFAPIIVCAAFVGLTTAIEI